MKLFPFVTLKSIRYGVLISGSWTRGMYMMCTCMYYPVYDVYMHVLSVYDVYMHVVHVLSCV